MIISANDIRAYRPIAQNIGAQERIDPYIQEVEELYIIPQFGARVYKSITSASADWVSTLKKGGFYDDDNAYFAGLTAAVAYLTYSRLVRNQSVNVTAFGVVYKNGELSERTDNATIARMSNEAQNIGLQHLHDCLAYLKHIGVIETAQQRIGNARFRVIGK